MNRYLQGLYHLQLFVQLNLHLMFQGQLKHLLGPHYAGDKISIVAERAGKDDEDKKQIEATVQLVAEVPPYVRPVIGVLPIRYPADDDPGVIVRYVISDSAAAKASLKPGDRIVAVGDTETPDAKALRERVAGLTPDDEIQVHYVRDNERQTAQLTLGSASTEIPAKLPPAHAALSANDEQAAERPAVGVVEINIPEETNKCFAYVPENYDARLQYGLIVWLPAPGTVDQDQLVDRWKAICQQRDYILLVPQARDAKRWSVPEVAFVRKTIDDVMQHYSVDRQRVVVHGYQAGGAMAYLVALEHRDAVRGVAVVDVALPRRVASATTDPSEPLSIYSAAAQNAKSLEAIQAGEKRLSELAFPVTTKRLPGDSRYLNEMEIVELGRWMDCLDRI